MEFIEILWSYGEYTTAPLGYEYVVLTLYLQNDGDQSITTSPHGWNLIAYVIKYEHDASTFNRSIGYQDIEIVKGRNIETKIVYLVKGNPTNIHLQFDGIWGIGPTFKEINHYVNRTSLWIGFRKCISGTSKGQSTSLLQSWYIISNLNWLGRNHKFWMIVGDI